MGLLAVLLSASAWALALPAPKDIEASVQSGNLSQAEQQLREVLAVKPTSARAHYELGQVLAREGRYAQALESLQQAQRLDSSLKFASSKQQFNSLLKTVEAKASAANLSAPAASTTTADRSHATVTPSTAPSPAHPSVAPSAPASGMPWSLMLGLGGLAAVVWWLMGRRSTPTAASSAPYTPSSPYSPYGGVPPAATSGAGSMAKGAVLGGLAGMAAGYALSKALEDEHPSSSSREPSGTTSTTSHGGGDYIPFDNTPSNDLGSFDAGQGDSWDSASSGGSDEW
ncbi:tetratricopeptide repeat protein [Hydrogenophaga soli]